MGYFRYVCGVRPMKSTEIDMVRLDNIHPGLRIVNQFHPSSSVYKDASLKQIATIKKGGMISLIEKRPI